MDGVTSTRDLLAVIRRLERNKPVLICHQDDFDILQEAIAKNHLAHAVRLDTSPVVPKGTYYYIDPAVSRINDPWSEDGE
jgi:hypothetical protein